MFGVTASEWWMIIGVGKVDAPIGCNPESLDRSGAPEMFQMGVDGFILIDMNDLVVQVGAGEELIVAINVHAIGSIWCLQP